MTECAREKNMLVALVFVLVLILPWGSASADSASSPEQRQRAGERMYLEGVLPAGVAMRAAVTGEASVPGITYACAGCHLRSGLGAVDEGVRYPAVNGGSLFKPLQQFPETTTKGKPRPGYLPKALLRPAYTDETLARALRSGIDSAGRKMADAMPRYPLDDEEMLDLISYLKTLSSQHSPGITAARIHLATVMTEDVPPAERDAMLISLAGFFNYRNRYHRLTQQADQGKLAMMPGDMTASLSQSITISPWLLTGAPETWRSQLEAHYREEPVFAFVGGISRGDWQPIHQFCEDHRIPCLFPITDLPVISRTDWYTVYLSKGYHQEGESAARFLDQDGPAAESEPVVQVVRDSPRGRALSRGFSETWHELGHPAPVTVILKEGQELNEAALRALLSPRKPAALMIWDGPAALPALESLGEAIRSRPVFLSAGYLGEALWSMKEALRACTYLTYPSSLPRTGRGAPWRKEASREDGQVSTIAKVLTMALMDMNGNFYRDYLLDLVGMMEWLDVPSYGRIGFGPGQRYGSREGSVAQLAKGNKRELVERSH